MNNHRCVGRLACLVVGIVLTACQDSPPSPTGAKLSICQVAAGATTGVTSDIYMSELADHLARGDYVTSLFVDHDNTAAAGDGIHFIRITDAVAAAREVRVARNELTLGTCPITIVVSAGVYSASVAASSDPKVEKLPIVLDFPSVALRGALQMNLDIYNRPLRATSDQQVTTIRPTSPLQFVNLLSDPIIVVNAHPDGLQGHEVSIEGFSFESGHVGVDALAGGQAILALRVRDLVIRGNQFLPLFTESIDLRATSGRVERSYLTGTGGTCDICLAGPGLYRATHNRLLAGGIPGILVSPVTLLTVPPGVEPYQLPTTAHVEATILNNEVRDHLRKPVGVGIRFAAVGLNAPNVAGSAVGDVEGNTLINNNFAMIVEAGFPVVNTLLKGDISLTIRGNAMSKSCQNDVLVSFSRHTTGLGLQNAPYLKNSTFSVDFTDAEWAGVWYSDPAGLGNSLVVGGNPIPNGSHTAYDATRVCPPGA